MYPTEQHAKTTQVPDFATIVRRHQAGIFRYLRVLGAEENTVADLTQETLLLLLEKPFEWHSDAQTAVWLRRAARNLFLGYCRRNSRAQLAESLDHIESAWA
ncbi:MAG: hypothetical protein KDB07_13515, partial [Planctomycetes bacterium]|nr:hypothetical protein [Planctomycetota bacterium]